VREIEETEVGRAGLRLVRGIFGTIVGVEPELSAILWVNTPLTAQLRALVVSRSGEAAREFGATFVVAHACVSKGDSEIRLRHAVAVRLIAPAAKNALVPF